MSSPLDRIEKQALDVIDPARSYESASELGKMARHVVALVNVAKAAEAFVVTTDDAPIPLAPFQAIPWDELTRALAALNKEPESRARA